MRKRSVGNFEQTAAPLLFLLPNVCIFTLFIIVPAFRGLRMAAFDWSILSKPVFVGWANFVELGRDAVFWRTFSNTLLYSVFTVPLSALVALGLALLLQDSRMAGVKIFRSLFYLPSLLSMITVGVSWRFLLGDEMGIVNYALRSAGFSGVHWLSEAGPAMACVILISVWAGAGYFMVIVLAGLQAIPMELYEGAKMDGASAWVVFRRITLPMLRSTMLVVCVLSTIASFKAYELIVVMTQGGPGYATKFIVQQVYQAAFTEDRMGYASTMSIVLLLLIVAITSVQFVLSGKEQDYE